MHQAIETEDFMKSYPATAKSSLERGIFMLEELITQVQESNIAQTRKKRFIPESKGYIDIIKPGEDVVPITATQYEQRIQQSTPDWNNNLIVCTSTEARDLLQRFTLQIPLHVPSELNNSPSPRILYSAQHYEAVLKFRKHASTEPYMDVQDLTSKNITRRLTISTALKRMSDPTALPINLLDIRPVRQNVLPWELDNLTDYSILSEATEYGGMSNHSDPNPSDLSSKTGFALWGKQGVWSFPHVDEHGLYTGVLCETGSKLWFTWSLSPSEREEWAESRQAGLQYAPNKPGFPIYLKKGDLLLMPPGTVHAPLSLEDDDAEPTFISALRELESPVNDDVLNLAATLGTPTNEAGIPSDDDIERAHVDYLRAARERDQARLDRSQERLRLLERQRDELEQRDRLRRVMSRLSRLSDNNYGDRVPSQNSLYDWSPATEAPGAPESSLRSTAILQSAGVRRHPRFSARTREAATSSEAPPRHASHRSLRDMLAARSSLFPETVQRERRQMSSHRDSEARTSPMLEQTVKYLSRIRHSRDDDESWERARDAGFLTKDFFLQHADFVANTLAIPPPTETSWLAPGAILSGCQHATTMPAAVTTTYSRHTGLPPPIRPWIWNPSEVSTSRNSQPDAQPHQDRWPVKVTIHDVDWEQMSLSATMEAYNVPSHPHPHTMFSPSNATPSVTRTSSITTYLEGEILDFNNYTLLTESFKSNAANDATYWRKLPPFQKMSDEDVVRALTSKKWLTEVLGQNWILMRWKERCFVKSLNRSTPDPVQPPPSTTIPSSFSADPPPSNPWASTGSSNYVPAAPTSTHTSQLQPSPYRIVRNAQTGRAEVEITPQPLFNSVTNDAEQATFDDSGCGLTISGFYYVALDRRSGMLEGLYYDPQSSPYQCLKLESVNGGLRTAWSFR
ncbi:hypothetical protein J4E89_000857 [Alternaria sp. Ai002NY15]|nr:hypothetical protein J4E89_000857 [Alternaria sp. Ai002NY15]